ncbi:MAG: hypothetical protein WA755_12370 [Candidatus Acidiferrales bacterium]
MKTLRWGWIALLGSLVAAAIPLAAQEQPAAEQPSQQTAQPSSQPTSQADSLAATARRAREQKKDQAKPAHVWDNDNLPAVGTVNVVGQSAEDSSAPAADASGTPTPDKTEGAAGANPPPAEGADAGTGADTKEDTHVQAAIQEAQEKIDDLKKDVDIAQRKYSLDSEMYYGKPDYTSDRAGKAALDSEMAGINDKKQQLAQAQQMLNELQAKLGASSTSTPPKQ